MSKWLRPGRLLAMVPVAGYSYAFYWRPDPANDELIKAQSKLSRSLQGIITCLIFVCTPPSTTVARKHKKLYVAASSNLC
jgi:hypothetical protein